MKTFQAIVASVAVALALAGPCASAQPYPNKPVKVMTPFPAGSGPDVALRLVGERLSKVWGQQVVVDNRPGGNGFIALQAAKQAPADGYTLVQVDNYHLAAHPHLYKKLPYDPVKDFDPVAPLLRNYFFITVPSGSPWKNVNDLIAAAKGKQGEITYGSWFIGSPGHLGAAALEGATGTRMNHIPFKDMNQLYGSVGVGDVNWALGSAASAGALYKAGKVRFLAVAAPTRIAGYADVPTVAESGGPANYEVSAWISLLAPKGTPAEIIAKINQDVARVLGDPEIQSRYATFAYEPFKATPAEMAKLFEAESRKFGDIVKRSSISLD
jgi:tripartite-type tricarboxylate transporter receptor subunit TctC